jgi:hypothetical protein
MPLPPIFGIDTTPEGTASHNQLFYVDSKLTVILQGKPKWRGRYRALVRSAEAMNKESFGI